MDFVGWLCYILEKNGETRPMNQWNEDKDLEELEEESFWEFNSKTVTFFLCILTLIVGVITALSFYDGIQVKKQEKVAVYIHEMNELLRKSEQYSNSIKDGLENGGASAISVEDEQEFRAIRMAAGQLSTPSGWEGHKEAATDLISARYMFFYHYFHGSEMEEEELESTLAALDRLENKEKEVLLSSFEASGISYRETEDGKITFSIKTY
jgi:hypothetical protein